MRDRVVQGLSTAGAFHELNFEVTSGLLPDLHLLKSTVFVEDVVAGELDAWALAQGLSLAYHT